MSVTITSHRQTEAGSFQEGIPIVGLELLLELKLHVTAEPSFIGQIGRRRTDDYVNTIDLNIFVRLFTPFSFLVVTSKVVEATISQLLQLIIQHSIQSSEFT